MAIFEPHLQILSRNLSNAGILNTLAGSLFKRDKDNPIRNKNYLWSWCGGKKKEKSVPNRARDGENCCRRRLPEYVHDASTPSKCSEPGLGKPIKKSWFSCAPTIMKQKPSNCPPDPCPKEMTLREYIFGPSSQTPLPDPLTCRRAYKNKQICQPEDPRLYDPRYQETKGDVLVFSETPKVEKDANSYAGPQAKSTPPYRPPNSVICKSFSDNISILDCYCSCFVPSKEPCQSNLCPCQVESHRVPFEEMRPLNPVPKFFTCETGIATRDLPKPLRIQACSGGHKGLDRKPIDSPPPMRHCPINNDSECKNLAVVEAPDKSPTPKMKISRHQKLAMEIAASGAPKCAS